MVFEIVRANITHVTSDAIVLPANTELKEGNGASSAIFEAAGRRKLTQACRKLGSCSVGSAVPTLAFNLDAKYIIHAVVPKWIDGEHNEYDLLSAAYLSALNIAEVLGCKTVAFPLLASGNNGFDLALAFEIAKESIESFSGTCLQKVYVVIYGNRISGVVKEKGFTIYELPPNLRKLELKAVHQEKVREFAEGGRDAVLRFMEAQIDKALIYLKDPNNVERAISMGIRIATAVIKAAKK